MLKGTILALLDAIEHWERLRDGTEDQEESEAPGRDDCALCRRFDYSLSFGGGFTCDRRKNGRVLEICPVRKATGKPTCEDTPYGEARDAWCEIRDDGKRRTKGRIAAMNREVEFLLNLLPHDYEEKER